jgi:hypothetical protein
MRLEVAFWGVWSWWPWTESTDYYVTFDKGQAKPFRLSKGNHTLYLGNMSAAFRIDKILVTSDQKYVPFGVKEHYYTGTFEPAVIVDAHDQYQRRPAVPLEAVGWNAYPSAAWSVREQPIGGNHYYFAADVSPENMHTTPTMALIRNLKCDLFTARFDLIFPEKREHELEKEFLLLFNLKDSTEFETLHFKNTGVELLRFRDSKSSVLKSARFPLLSERWRPQTVFVRRGRTDIRVEIDSRTVLEANLSFPGSGMIGVGSYTGGVGFDNIEVCPLADPSAEFDFPKAEAEALRDWVVLRNGTERQWSPHEGFERNDVLLYKAPFWSGSQIRIALAPEASGIARFSLLFPYVDSNNLLELKIDPRSGGELELIRHLNGTQERGKKANLMLSPTGQTVLVVQCSRGLFCTFQEERKLLEANEYNLFEGTIGFHFPEAIKALPITSLSVERKDVVVDTFPLDQSGSLLSGWQITDGNWRVGPVPDGDPENSDGQLVAQGKGEVLIGQGSWKTYFMQISAYLGQDTDFGLLGWCGADGFMELHCTKTDIELRKVCSGASAVIAKANVPQLTDGWHRIDIAWKEKEVTAEIDERQILQAPVSGGTGQAGIHNYAQHATFDDLAIHVLSSQVQATPQVKPVDPVLKEIEEKVFQ